MFKRFMRFVPIIALFLFALLMINQPRTADASPKGDITFNYAPEHMSLSRARDGQFLSGPAAGDAGTLVRPTVSPTFICNNRSMV